MVVEVGTEDWVCLMCVEALSVRVLEFTSLISVINISVYDVIISISLCFVCFNMLYIYTVIDLMPFHKQKHNILGVVKLYTNNSKIENNS